MRTLRALLAFAVGATGGFFAGSGLLTDLPTRAYRQDLLPPPADWGRLYWLTVLSWLAALGVACAVRRLRPLAVGWLVGVPALLLIALVYNWHTWGTWGQTPTIP
jgi:hypothetical protein